MQFACSMKHDVEDNPFADGDQSPPLKNVELSNVEAAVEYLREELQKPAEQVASSALQIPVFLRHGAEDEKVPVQLGREAADFLRNLHFGIEYFEYEGLAHWYSGEMLRDILRFLARRKDQFAAHDVQ